MSLYRLEVPVRAAVELEVVPSLLGDGEEEGVRGVFLCRGFVVFDLERSKVVDYNRRIYLGMLLKKILHTGNTRPSRTCVIQEYRFYTMSLSQYHGTSYSISVNDPLN